MNYCVTNLSGPVPLNWLIVCFVAEFMSQIIWTCYFCIMYFTHSSLTSNKSHCCSFIRLMLRIIVLLPLKCKHIFRKKMPQTSWHLNRVDCGIMSWNPSHESSFHLSCQQWVGPYSGLNLFWPRDDTWRHSSGTLAQVIVGCLTSPSLHPNQCWLIIHLWHSPESDYTRNAHDFFSATCV